MLQIPGHHFPPVIAASLIVYLACIRLYPDAFYSQPTTAGQQTVSNGTAEKLDESNGISGGVKVLHDEREPLLNNDKKSFLRVVLLGTPHWKNHVYSYLSIGFNVVLALFAADFVFRGPLLHTEDGLRFSRVGFVNSNSAKVLFREPDPTQLPVYVYYSPTETQNWVTVDRIYYLDDETDYTYPVTFSGLQPSTSYVYSLSNNLTGAFTTAPSVGSPTSGHLTFLTSSCIKANFPYSPFSHSLSIPGFKYLSTLLQSLPKPASFMVFLGDFIYVDVPLRLSSTTAHYRSEYRRVYASPSWNLPGVSSVPWINTLDDHEIANDWAAGNETDPFPAASDPFLHYHVSVNPPVPPTALGLPQIENITYFQFTHGPASFFMLDTRRYRTSPEPPEVLKRLSIPEHAEHTILGAAQLGSLLTYLTTPEPPHIHWKIIASSVPFTKNWRFGTSDSWGGYLTERAKVLAAMHAAEANLGIRVVVLSGDRHEFAAVRFPPPLPPGSSRDADDDEPSEVRYSTLPAAGPHEFSVGPLSMFYLPFRTFAQTSPEDTAIKYIADGNSKIGVVEIRDLVPGENGETDEGESLEQDKKKSVLRYTLWIDGEIRWAYSLTSPAPGYRKKGLLEGLLDWAGVGAGRNST